MRLVGHGRFKTSSYCKCQALFPLTSGLAALKQRLPCLRMDATKVLSRSPMLWNMTRPSGMPTSAYTMQKERPATVAGVECP